VVSKGGRDCEREGHRARKKNVGRSRPNGSRLNSRRDPGDKALVARGRKLGRKSQKVKRKR